MSVSVKGVIVLASLSVPVGGTDGVSNFVSSNKSVVHTLLNCIIRVLIEPSSVMKHLMNCECMCAHGVCVCVRAYMRVCMRVCMHACMCMRGKENVSLFFELEVMPIE